MQTKKIHNPKYRSYIFSGAIINLVKSFPNNHLYWSLGDQVLRSGTSIGANLAEAKYSSSKKEYIRYYKIALKSGNETLYWLSLFRDYLEVGDVSPLIQECTELVKMISSSIITMQKDLKS